MEPSDRNEEVITSDNRIVGCRGRVLVAVLMLAALALILAFTLLYRLFTWTPPVPRGAASEISAPVLASLRGVEPARAPVHRPAPRISYNSSACAISATLA
ncbi:hypothetical protein [Sphingosinicella sp. YJ22]|uniref:hypothetical protein n=1 Tax=Sphingosinicella sp. YJ22 TaxID=1104780 RepID=UPI00140A0F40|nr:hypothetical protein [Sphingosinicella sp. YJ22]